jgi:hypothetical protein
MQSVGLISKRHVPASLKQFASKNTVPAPQIQRASPFRCLHPFRLQPTDRVQCLHPVKNRIVAVSEKSEEQLWQNHAEPPLL